MLKPNKRKNKKYLVRYCRGFINDPVTEQGRVFKKLRKMYGDWLRTKHDTYPIDIHSIDSLDSDVVYVAKNKR